MTFLLVGVSRFELIRAFCTAGTLYWGATSQWRTSASNCMAVGALLLLAVERTVTSQWHAQGQGYITTNNQSVSMSWYGAQSRTIDQSLLSP
jgi:hypothetical protein